MNLVILAGKPALDCFILLIRDDLATSFELSLPLFDRLCNTHVLTEVTIISLHLYTTTNAHLPERYHTKSRRGLQIILISRIILLETSQRLLERLCLNIYLQESLNQVIRFVVV